jgi:hypothetical protein
LYGELELMTHESVDRDFVRGSVEVRNWAMVSIVAIFRYETIPPISTTRRNNTA